MLQLMIRQIDNGYILEMPGIGSRVSGNEVPSRTIFVPLDIAKLKKEISALIDERSKWLSDNT